MKKVYPYIVMFLSGVIAGLITMYKLTGDTINVTVRKVKSKRTSGQTSTTIPIVVKNDAKQKRNGKKEARKQKRIVRHNESKLARNLKRLEKNN